MSTIQTIAVIGNHLPRQCGIATYTTDLCAALTQSYPATDTYVLAMNDRPDGYEYPASVRFSLDQDSPSSYRHAAHAINISNADVVCVQHEYGIFGGAAGGDILALLRDLRAPIITTLHTILRTPTTEQYQVLCELIEVSDRIVVMSESGSAMLQSRYDAPAAKIDVIAHGIPDMPFWDTGFAKASLQAEGRHVLLTFGLLSRNKGIEQVIAALPAIIAQHPNVLYCVVGTTHPNIRQSEGEAYRDTLQQLAHELGVAQAVRFYDQFVTPEELQQFISAADMYITPYLNEAQIVSGTLAYAVGAGKAVISTPYWHAAELLADGCGRLVPFGDSAAIAENVIALLDDPAACDAMRRNAYARGRAMIWPHVSQQYMQSFVRARDEHRLSARVQIRRQTFASQITQLPPLNFTHLQRMTDSTGMLQHATMAIPNPNEGYTTDDNARALIAAIKLEELDHPRAFALASRYLGFLWHAFQPELGRFRNFMAYDRQWCETIGSEDSHARALWALGTTIGRSIHPALVEMAGMLFSSALPASRSFVHLRPMAFALLGIHEYLQRFDGDYQVKQMRQLLAEQLLTAYQRNQTAEWPWFEARLTYDNAVLAHALLLSGSALGNQAMQDAGLASLQWLWMMQRSEIGHFVPIGCDSFSQQAHAPARFDQQPIEAHAMVMAALSAYHLTGQHRWLIAAQSAFAWFLGYNDLCLALYDPTTGGCCDGLLTDRVNQNQGAESTLAFLLARLEWTQAFDPLPPFQTQEQLPPEEGLMMPLKLSNPRSKGWPA